MSYVSALAQMQRGRSNPSDYQLIVPFEVSGRQIASRDTLNYMRYYCRAVTLPGTSHSITQMRGHENLGVARNVMSGKNFGSPVVLTFSERSDLTMYSFLKDWMDSGFLNSEQTGNRNLRANYYDSVAREVIIEKLEPETNSTISNPIASAIGSAIGLSAENHVVTGRFTLINAIPLAIEQTTLALESSDSMLDFTLSLAYESFKFENLSLNNNNVITDTLSRITSAAIIGANR